MVKRRDFIKKSMAGTAGIAIGGMGFSARSYGAIMGANNRVNVAMIGIGGRGKGLIRDVLSLKGDNVSLVTLCDVDEKFFAAGNKVVFDESGIKPKNEWDMRKVFEDKNIDAVWFATPNHWHALGTIWACQAGKHVYVEKPCSYSVFEGRKMIEAARKYNVCVQVGFQSRADKWVQEAMKFLHEGGIGEVYMARGLCLKPRANFGIAPDGTPPDTLHYDMWLGPAAWQPYNEKKVHYNWHWHWNTGNGDTGNQGPHQFDLARWGLNKNVHPVSVYSTGGIFGWKPEECSQETPDVQSSLFKYADGKILEFETRGRASNREGSLNTRVGNIFYGTKGFMELDKSDWKAYYENETEPFAGSAIHGPARQSDPTFLTPNKSSDHSANLINAIRSGDPGKLFCDTKEGHFSSALPHLANISYRLGRPLTFMGDYEKFANDDAANLMLTRKYRKPYVITKEV